MFIHKLRCSTFRCSIFNKIYYCSWFTCVVPWFRQGSSGEVGQRIQHSIFHYLWQWFEPPPICYQILWQPNTKVTHLNFIMQESVHDILQRWIHVLPFNFYGYVCFIRLMNNLLSAISTLTTMQLNKQL